MVMNKKAILAEALSKSGIMSMRENELDFLFDFCKGKDVLELGSFEGASSIVIASVCNTLHCVDTWDDSYEHLKRDKGQQSCYLAYEYKNIYDTFIANCHDFIKSKKLIMHRGNTNDIHADFLNNGFDILIIDADHTHYGVSNDFFNYKDKVKDDGYIIFHDYGTTWQDIKNFCDFIEFNKIVTKKTIINSLGVFTKNQEIS
jgi:hypothetical protein